MINVNNIVITPEMLTKIAEIDTFNASWVDYGIKLKPEQLKSMKRIATIESIGSSNRIEGNKLADSQVEALFSHIKNKSFTTRDEQEVAGYADLLNTIFDNFNAIPLSENYIKQLHKTLLHYSDKDERHRGNYKTVSNMIADFGASGKEIGTIFETVTPFNTPMLMKELVELINDNFEDRYLHPIITIGLFIVHFLSIHPFTDGNGRLSRALTLLLMLKNGYTYIPYSPMEQVIEASKEGYYRALKGTQKTIWKDNVDYEPWLTFFITSLQKQKKYLEDKIKEFKNKPVRLNPTAQKILSLFDKKQDWATAEISKELEMNIETVKKQLQNLVKQEVLIKNGSTKSAYYL